jgi:predicted DNA-binding antitoxin AbrB/MazE fold protein
MPPTNPLNAESVTSVVTSFLKRIGNKGFLKPKKVTLKEGVYSVEVEMKKFNAVVRVDAETREIKEYEIQPKSEETAQASISPRIIIIMVGISAAIFTGLHFAFRILGL